VKPSRSGEVKLPAHGLETLDDAEDLVRGLTILGVGGGGEPRVGISRLSTHLAVGKVVRWVDPGSVPDDAWTCVMGGVGSIAPQDPLSREERRRLGYGDKVVPYPGIEAIRELEAYTGKKISALVPLEPGAGSTTILIDAAMRVGLSLVDGDYCGRAVPELSQAISAIYSSSYYPCTQCDPWGNVVIIKRAPSVALVERLGKMVSVVTKLPDAMAPCATANFLLEGNEMREFIVPGTLTKCLRLGRAIREARHSGAVPVQAAVNTLNGWQVFHGEVVSKEWENRDGYMYGTTVIEGRDSYAGQVFKIWFQNENHISWKNGQPFVTSPDLLAVLNSQTAEPITNAALEKGMSVVVVGMAADPRYRSRVGLDSLGPRHFGFDLEYRPIEEIMGVDRESTDAHAVAKKRRRSHDVRKGACKQAMRDDRSHPNTFQG
jgi:DUF917 family protein